MPFEDYYYDISSCGKGCHVLIKTSELETYDYDEYDGSYEYDEFE